MRKLGPSDAGLRSRKNRIHVPRPASKKEECASYFPTTRQRKIPLVCFSVGEKESSMRSLLFRARTFYIIYRGHHWIHHSSGAPERKQDGIISKNEEETIAYFSIFAMNTSSLPSFVSSRVWADGMA